MSEQKWPERGQMSADRKHYTHTDGSVHSLGHQKDYIFACKGCSLIKPCDEKNREKGLVCGQHGPFRQVSGAYVPTADERVAEKVMRAMIAMCPGRDKDLNTCHGKGCFDLRTCPLRRYLSDELHDPKAWEVLK